MTVAPPNPHRQCTRDLLRTEIVRRILDGRYPPDMRLKEMALAKEFGTSQAPVREALRDLEALGLVENERYCGTRVLSASSVDLCEAYELRSLIESRAAELAVPCKPQDISVLTDQLNAMRIAAHNKDPESYSAAALIFHRTIVMLSGNHQFLKAFDAMQWGVRARIAVYRVVGDLVSHCDDHAEVLDLLRQGDGIGAGKRLNLMLTGFINTLCQINQNELNHGL